MMESFKEIQYKYKKKFNTKYKTFIKSNNFNTINKQNIIQYILSNKILIKKIEINKKDKNGITILMYAVIKNNIEWCKLLIENLVNINIRNSDGNTALMIATKNNNIEICELLIKNGSHIDIRNSDGNTALIIAIKNNNIEIYQLLIKNNSNIHIKNISGNTPLMIAIEKNNIEICESLIKNGSDLNIINVNRDTPLMIAIKNNNIEICKLLINNLSDINLTNKIYNNILIFLIIFYYKSMYDLFRKIISNSNYNINNQLNNYSNIFEENTKNNIELIILLIKKNENLEYISSIISNTLIFIIKNNYNYNYLIKKIIQKSIENNLSINLENKKIISILTDYDSKLINLLIDKCKNINIKDKNGYPLLIYSTKNNNIAICELLIKNGSDVNIENNDRDTSLMIAIKNNNIKIFKLLIKNEKINIQKSEIKKALDFTFDINKLYMHNILLILENSKNSKNIIKNIDNINYSLNKNIIKNIIKKQINEYKINGKINFENILKYFYLLSDYNKNIYQFIYIKNFNFTINKELSELISYINNLGYNFFTLNKIKINYNNSIGQNVGGLSRQFFDNLEIQISNNSNKVSDKDILNILSISKMNSNPIFCNNNNIKLLILNNISKEFKYKIEKNLIFNLLNLSSLKDSDSSNPDHMFLHLCIIKTPTNDIDLM